MNGSAGLKPVYLKIYNDTTDEFEPQLVFSKDARKEIVDPETIKARLEHLKFVIKETISTNYNNRLKQLDEDESGYRDEDKAFVLEYTDASTAIRELETETSKVPEMICRAVDPYYDEAVKVCRYYQSLYNDAAWTEAYHVRSQMGVGAKIEEVYISGGTN